MLLQKVWETTKGAHVVILQIYFKEWNLGCALQHLANMHLINKSCLMDLGTTTLGIWCLYCLRSLWGIPVKFKDLTWAMASALTKSSFLLICISKQHLVKGLKATKTTFRLDAQVRVGSLPILAVSSRTTASNFLSSLMEPHFSPQCTGWTSMPDWHFTVKLHLPLHTSILFGSLLQTLVPRD